MKSNSSNRIAYWDNLKAILIFLVVFGHFLLPIHSSRGICVNAVYTWIYLFHMPAFIFVSGFFSKKYVTNGANDIRKIIGFIVLYILYSLPTWISTALIAHKSVNFFSPTSAQWYLLCMALWYIIIPYCAKLKAVPMLIISIAIGLLVGLDINAGAFLSLSRCIVFFPFFLAGFHFDGLCLHTIKSQYKTIALLILLIALISTFLFPEFYNKHISILYADSAYSSAIIGVIERAIWYLLSNILVGALLFVIPHRPLPFTYIGQRTLAIYILHRPLRGICRYFGLYDYLNSDFQALLFCLILSLLLTFLLSEKHISILLNKVFKVDYKFILPKSSY